MERIYIVMMKGKCVSAYKNKCDAEKMKTTLGTGATIDHAPLITETTDNHMEHEGDSEWSSNYYNSF